jgi:hypothetical protein
MLSGTLPCPEIEDIIFMINIIKDYIYNLDIPLGTSIRLDCPICDGTNTLSVTQFSDCVKYYCFHANCSKGGVIKEGLSISSFSAQDEILKPNEPVGLELEKQNWRKNNLPAHFFEYIKRNNCIAAWSKEIADIRYDYKRDRAVFLVKDRTKIVDAAGRYIGSGLHSGPKWYRYGGSKLPFICGKYDHAVIVEDCASAASVSGFATGVALLGTFLQDEALSALDGFKNITVALDKDASDKSVDIALRLNAAYGDIVDVCLLDRDLKRLTEDEAKEVLKI